MKPRIVVIGSINMDLVCRTSHIPVPGETVLGDNLRLIPGGKGANQAVAAARLGGRVAMIGRVGHDGFGATLLRGLKKNGVDVEHVKVKSRCASGCALITVAENGANSIVVSPGANAALTPKDIEQAKGIIRTASVVVMQLEIPLDTIDCAISLCRGLGVRTILDPAPAPTNGLPESLYKVDVLSPNESEAQALTRRKERYSILAQALLSRGPGLVVLKRGEHGAMIVGQRLKAVVHPFKVKPIDTTAAGDAFTAGLAVACGEKMPIMEAVRFANAAGALCCTRFGAQPSLPRRSEVARLLATA